MPPADSSASSSTNLPDFAEVKLADKEVGATASASTRRAATQRKQTEAEKEAEKKKIKATLRRQHWAFSVPVFVALLLLGYIAYLALTAADNERAKIFARLMAEGDAHLKEGLFDQAETFYRTAGEVDGYENNDAIALAVNSAKRARAAAAFHKQVNHAAIALAHRDYDTALKTYDAALKMPGYSGDRSAAQKGWEQARALVQQEHDENFARDFADAKVAWRQSHLSEAEMLFRRALTFPGHENDKEVPIYLQLIEKELDKRAGVEDAAYLEHLRAGSAAFAARKWTDATAEFQAAIDTGYANNAAAKAGLQRAQTADASARNEAIYREHIKIAEAALAQNHYEEAAKEFTAAQNVPGYAYDKKARDGAESARKLLAPGK
ncbi:hypothetical protein FACS1894139_16440 [Planctomycetales bacterium]|nr:hypothetical protein FACS1894107_17310 [Planctomycetales bacterium]GHT07718.1 hypothetical protein FACS1894139_16440 [Planctomycetales bacterium]